MINHSDLHRLDLSLLVVFDAIHAERSVTRASRRLNIGQPAVSAALGRLRDLLGDELFVKAPGGVVATPRADALIPAVREILISLQDLLLTERSFDISREQRLFTIGVNDSFEELWLPALAERIQKDAPGVDLQAREADTDSVIHLMDAGAIDLAIGVYGDGGHQHRRRFLYRDRYECVFDAAQIGTDDLGLDGYLAAPHVLGSSRGLRTAAVDAALAEIGAHRRVFVSTPHFSAIPFYLRTFPCVATLPERVAAHYGRIFGLARCAVPVTTPEPEVFVVWHTSHDRDPFNRWMRELISECVR